MTRRYPVFLLTALVFLTGCEYFVSDVATRIRYALVDESARLLASGSETATVSLRPDHWPDACRGGGYRLTLRPYQGGKYVAVGDIIIDCRGGGGYYTGMGAETIYVTQPLTIDKGTDDALRITLRKTTAGTEIVRLE